MTDSAGVTGDRLHALDDCPDDWHETALQVAGDGVYQLDLDGRFVVVDDVVLEETGYEAEQLLGEHASMLVDDASVRAIERGIRALIDGTVDGTLTRDAKIQTANGERFPVEIRMALVRTDGEVTGTVGVVRHATIRERWLATLNDVSRVLQDVSHAIVGADGREELERFVTERLAAADTFAFALFGEVDGDDVEITTAAGVEDHLDDPDGGEPTPGLVARAAHAGAVRTVDDALADPDQGERAREWGYRSMAAVPVSCEGVRYGVLSVYAAEPGVFNGEVESIVSRLGGVVGHAINALDRKRALAGEEITELEIRVPDVLDRADLDRADLDRDERIEFESVLPTDDGTYAAYGSTTPAGVETLRALAAALPRWQELSIRERAEDAAFAIETRDPPLVSLAAALGGRVTGTVFDGDTFRTTVHLPYDADVREFVERARTKYPEAEVVAQRHANRPNGPVDALGTVLDERLTDRQRVALEAAYVSGFFEWPRDATGEDVAESMGVSPATFHQHLREAQRRIVTELFDSLRR